PHHITSMLDAGILVEGKLVGVISCAQTREKRKWHLDEEAFVSTIAAFVGQTLSNIDRKFAEKALLETQEQIRIQQGKFQKELLRSIIQILELYDLYTSGHSENVAHYSALIAEQVKLDPPWIKQVYWTGLVHDIGKLLVPTQILNKPSGLTDEEYELVKMHPVWGAKVLKTSEQLTGLATDVRHHHERYDGKGYPDGLAGTRIPLTSRIIAVADAYDAMISERSYRTPYTVEKAKEELLKNRGTQFDPELVDVFLSIIDKSKRNAGKDRSVANNNG
ncbi:MAG TPA: HD domain-containing phosphohydrolase, partial [Thermotogota bacterium]|nr:HD domain-containing phosphohydrolase [Thermotogota bacterium]